MAAVLYMKFHQFSLGVAVSAFQQVVVRYPGEFNGRSIHHSPSTTRTFYFKEQLYFSHFEMSSEWVIEKWVDRSTWRLFLLNSFLDTKWLQAMMKDSVGDNIFLGALFDPGSSSNIFLKQIICSSCLGFNLIDQECVSRRCLWHNLTYVQTLS